MEWIEIAKAVIYGLLCAIIARIHGRPLLLWFFIGAFLQWIGLLILFFLPVPIEIEKSPEEKELPAFTPPQIEPISNWFYLDAEKKIQGPISVDVIKEQWNKGLLSKESWVWNQGLDQWQKINQIRSLYDWLTKSQEKTLQLG